MPLKRKPRNRRFERDHLLDVKVESRQLRAIRLRLAVAIVSRVLALTIAVWVLWNGGAWLLDEFVFKNPAFAIQQIEVETDGILPLAQLRQCAGVKIGENLLVLDLNRIQRDLECLPWIQSAAVERLRPHTLKIRVVEREPIAQTTLFEPGGSNGRARSVVFYFDADGYVMLPLEAHQVDLAALGFDTLPTLSGVAGVDLRPGHQVESRQIKAALRLLADFNRSPMLGLVDLTGIDLSWPQLLQVTTAQSSSVVFGVEQLELQLRRWRLVHDYATRNGKSLASLDLSVSNNVPARWLESAMVPVPKTKAPKASPYRKKHV